MLQQGASRLVAELRRPVTDDGIPRRERGSLEFFAIAINPRLCRKWKGLEFHLAYKGDDFRLTITRAAVTIASLPGNTRSHRMLVAGKSANCRPGKKVTVRYGPGQ